MQAYLIKSSSQHNQQLFNNSKADTTDVNAKFVLFRIHFLIIILRNSFLSKNSFQIWSKNQAKPKLSWKTPCLPFLANKLETKKHFFFYLALVSESCINIQYSRLSWIILIANITKNYELSMNIAYNQVSSHLLFSHNKNLDFVWGPTAF